MHNFAACRVCLCVACVVFGALFILNLMIAVQFNFLDEAFTEIDEQKKKEQQKH